MAIIARDNTEQRAFVPAPAGLHPARLVDIVDLGIINREQNGIVRSSPRVRLIFQLDKLMDDGRAFITSAFFNPSLNEKSRLRPFLESWLNRRFTDDEARAGLDLVSLIGCTALVQLLHTERKGTTYADIMSILPLPGNYSAEFPDYCTPDGTVLVPSTRPEPKHESSPIMQRTDGTIAPASNDPARTRLVVAVQRRGAQLYGGSWPEFRKVILATLELPPTVDELSSDQLRQVEHYLAAEADEHEERAAIAA